MGATSDVAIVNAALVELGKGSIVSLTEKSRSARAANIIFNKNREEVLGAHKWNELVTRSKLAKLSGTPEFGFDAQYQLPGDFLALVRMGDSRARFRIERDKVLTDDDSVDLIYIALITDTAKWSDRMKEVMSLKLAWKLAITLTGSRTLASEKKSEYRKALDEAMYQDSIQSPADSVESFAWEDARFSSTSATRDTTGETSSYGYS